MASQDRAESLLCSLDTIDGAIAAAETSPVFQRLPGGKCTTLSLKVLLENLLRNEDGRFVKPEDIVALTTWDPARPATKEIAFAPARVLLQDFTGVPLLVDLAAMRAAMARLGRDPARGEPGVPVDLVEDHSVQVDAWGDAGALERNLDLEYQRNRPRYEFLRWGSQAFHRLRIVPPGVGICHQVNLEFLATVVGERDGVFFPDTLVGTDSHTTMANGLGVVGWGVGGIEAEAAMLGQPAYFLTPDVVGVHLSGSLRAGVTGTDLVLTALYGLRLGLVSISETAEVLDAQHRSFPTVLSVSRKNTAHQPQSTY